MGALKLTACMKVVAKMGDMDQESLLERLDRYTADGVPKDRAQLMAASDTLAELQDERREFMAMLRQQHPDLFRVTNAIPEDQDVDPDAPDIQRSPGRSEEEIAAARADGWTIADNDLPSREAAERIVKLRTKGNSVVKPMAAWQDVEVRVVESDNPGFWAIETRKADIQRSPGRNNEVTIDLSADRAARQKAKDWVAKVSEMFPRNPMDGRQRVMMFGEEDMALFELDDSVTRPGAVEIKWIQAYPLRSGNGTKAMQELQRLATEDGMSLTLYPWDKGRVSQASLIKFYKKQGFEPVRKGGKDMIWRPEGEIKRSPARMYTDTTEFKRWFGDSKVVDADGKPMVVYHGTIVRPDTERVKGMGDIQAFDRMFTTKFRAPSLDTVGSWFSTNPGEGGAEMYSGRNQGSTIYPVYLSIQNPQVTTFQLMQRRARLLANGKDDGRQIGAEEVEAYRKWLMDTGKDGIKIEGSGNDGSTEFDNQDAWIALEPEQIKSAIGNSGTFDPATADITRSPGRDLDEVSPGFWRDETRETEAGGGTGQDITWTPEFKRWFGDSVMTEDGKPGGKPMTLYHGGFNFADAPTGKAVPKVSGRGALGAGFYMTPSEELSSDYAYENDGVVNQVYARIKRPLEIRNTGSQDPAVVALEMLGVPQAKAMSMAEKAYEKYGYIGNEIKSRALDAGYDGLTRYSGDELVEVVVWTPTQVKSATNNDGQFSWNPDIRRSPARAQEDTPEFKAWFDGSQVVDEDGRPKVMYHSTNAMQWGSTDLGFSEFLTGTSEMGAHFGTIEQANSFGNAERRRVMPVYLSIKNPLRLEDRGDFKPETAAEQLVDMGLMNVEQLEDLNFEDKERGIEIVKSAIEQAGYDGVVYLNRREGFDPFGPDGVSGEELNEMTDRDVIDMFGDDAQDSWIAFRPEQIKSATGNRGTFDPNDADITRSPGRTATGAAWDSPSASKWDDAVYKLQDKQVDLKRVTDAIQEAGGAIADDLNVYLQEELYHGRAAKRTEDFVNLELNPLVEQLAKDGLQLEDLEEFLHARHAPEANAVIAQRNPGVQDLQDGGSGMKTADAMNYMAGLPADLRQKLEAAAAKVDDILKSTREMYVDYELESRDTVDAWGKMFQHYIPLMREDKDGNGSPGLGQGFSIKGKEVKGRTGSTRKVVDILANIALQRERAIVRGEKNRVSQALVGLASSNPNEGFWVVDEVPTERVFNEKTGLVEDRVDPLYKSRPNAIIAKIKGADGKVKEHAVLFNEEDERAVRMAAALKNLDASQLEGLMGVSATISRYFASINTSLNPIFGVVNAIRDIQGVALNLSSTPIDGEQTKVLRNTASAIAGIYGDARKARKGVVGNSKWANLWEEFQSVGGQTGYRDLFRTSEDRAEAIKKTLNPDGWADSKLGKIFTAGGVLKVPLGQARRAAAWLFDLIEDYNLAMENGVRLSVYKAGLDRGLSKEQAASIAKNASTNFNRKGQIGQQAGALYAFFNASVQGTARIGQTLFDMEPGKPKTLRLSSFGKKVVYGGMMLGVMQALALAAAGYNEDDPPDFVRERSLVIPVAGGKYITIPMPLGFNVIPNIGRMAAEFAMSGFKNPEERAVKLISLFAEALNPIGNAGLSMQTLAPTALDPFVALTENKDYTGKPIARESSNEAIPGHALGRDTASSLSKFLSESINALSGGNKYVAGVFSPSPDQIEYLLGQLTGGVGRELSKIEQSTLATARGEDLPTYKIPLVGRFVGDTRSQASEGTAFYANTERLNRLETEIKGLQKDGKNAEAAELRRSSSEAYLITMANQAERQIQKLRAEKRELVKADAPREQVAAIEERITAVMARLNRAVEGLREKQEN